MGQCASEEPGKKAPGCLNCPPPTKAQNILLLRQRSMFNFPTCGEFICKGLDRSLWTHMVVLIFLQRRQVYKITAMEVDDSVIVFMMRDLMQICVQCLDIIRADTLLKN